MLRISSARSLRSRSAVALSDGATLTLDHFPSLAKAGALPCAGAVDDDADVALLPAELLEERQVLRAQLEALRWNVSQVARSLGISRNTLYRRMHKLRIPVTQID